MYTYIYIYMVTDPRGTHVVVHIMHGVHMFIYDLYMIKYAQHKKVYGTYVPSTNHYHNSLTFGSVQQG